MALLPIILLSPYTWHHGWQGAMELALVPSFKPCFLPNACSQRDQAWRIASRCRVIPPQVLEPSLAAAI